MRIRLSQPPAGDWLAGAWAELGNLNDLFSENDKIHRMKTRAEEKYKVQHANTERLKHNISAENVES